MRNPTLYALSCALILSAALSVPQALAAAGDQARTLSLSANGSVSAKPDIAMITVGVQSQAATAHLALRANSQNMRRVISALRDSGLTARDMQTANFSVQPRYKRARDGRQAELEGYQVSNTLHITVRDIANIGDILDLVVEEGSNQINGIQFVVSDAETRKDEARKRAIENALRKAQTYANAADVRLGEIIRIDESGGFRGPSPMVVRSAMAVESVPIEAGQQTLQVQVHVTWTLE